MVSHARLLRYVGRGWATGRRGRPAGFRGAAVLGTELGVVCVHRVHIKVQNTTYKEHDLSQDQKSGWQMSVSKYFTVVIIRKWIVCVKKLVTHLLLVPPRSCRDEIVHAAPKQKLLKVCLCA